MPTGSDSLEATSRHYYVSVLPQTRDLLYYPITVGRFDCKPSYQVERCSFHSYLLIIMHRGELRFHNRKGCGVARAGQVLLLDCNLPHGYAAQGACSFSYIHFDGAQTTTLCSMIERQRGLVLTPPDTDALTHTLTDIMDRLDAHGRLDETDVSAKIYGILMSLLGHASALGDGTTGVALLDNVVRYIQMHLPEKLTVASIAAQVGYSASYLSRLFTRESGMSLYQFILKTRLSRARYLLSATRDSVESIAFQTGFLSTAHFSQTFCRETGMSPSEYRRRAI